MTTRMKFLLAALALQFVVLGWMAGKREWIVRTGREVWLRTMPVDPQDLFRGEYVRLNYEISSLDDAKFGPALQAEVKRLRSRDDTEHYRQERQERVVYVTLRQRADGVAEVVAVDLAKPAAGQLFIKGRGRLSWWDDKNAFLSVQYGIDAYYVEQGQGRKLERRVPTGMPNGIQAPLEMKVALGGDGTAVLKDYRWCPLGLAVELFPPRTGNAKATPAQPRQIKVTFCNVSDRPLAVVLPSDLRTLRLVQQDNSRREVEYGQTAATTPPDWTPAATDLTVLAPGAKHSILLDPRQPRWFLTVADGARVPLGDKKHYHSARMVYEPPPAASPPSPAAAAVWQGRLASPAISSYEFQENE